MLTFLMSLRHPDNSADYGRVEDLARRTLRSLAAQTDQRCTAVVVANRPLELSHDLSLDVRVVVVDFPAPSAHRGPSTGREAVLLDKGTKLAVALAVARSGHVMFVDADDFVNVSMTAFVGNNSGLKGWYVDQGLVLDERSRLCYPVDRFNKLCGTSLVVRRDCLPPMNLTPGISQEELLHQCGEAFIKETFGSHRHLAGRLSLDPLPFMGAAYAVGTGENHSGKGMVQSGRPLTDEMACRFGVQPRSRWPSYGYYVYRNGRALGRRLQARVGRVLAKRKCWINQRIAMSADEIHEG